MLRAPSVPMRPLTLVGRAVLSVAVFAAVLVSSAGSPPTASAAVTTPFDDVPAGAFYHDAVAWLADTGITTGTTASTFSPDDPVTRGQMAAFLQRYAQVTDVQTDPGFDDLPAGAFYTDAVGFLVERAITTGTSPTTFSPNDVVTRAQMAAFLWRFSLEPTPASEAGFVDVPDGRFFSTAVDWLAERGITTGTSATTYSPGDVVTRGQMATFLWRLAGEPVPGDLGVNRVDVERISVLEDADLGPATVIDPEGSSMLEIATTDPEEMPEVGDVVALGVTETTPSGFLGMVEEVDGTMVTTSPATLQDAIPEADIATEIEFDDIDDDLGLASTEQSETLTATCSSGATMDVDVDFGVEAGLVIEASWNPFDGVEAFVGFRAVAGANATVSASGAVECEAVVSVDGPNLKKFTIWIGPVPVVIVPKMTFEAILAGSIEAEGELSAEVSQSVEAGLRFEDGAWSTVFDASRTPLSTNIDLAARATVSLDLRARLDMLLYGAAGPYLAVGPFIEFGAQTAIPWWTVDAGVRAQIGATIDVGFFKDEVAFPAIELARFRLADSAQTAPPFPPELLSGAALQGVSHGSTSSCAIGSEGSAWCWGWNLNGRLGRGFISPPGPASTVIFTTAEPVVDLNADPFSASDDVVQVAASGQHACARIADGAVWCWGSNGSGRLGDGTETDRSRPVQVPGITDAIDIDANGTATCAVLADYTVRCWGSNASGQLGDGTFENRLRPVAVQGLTLVRDISVGSSHVCAVRATGDVWCWGRASEGQLGNASNADSFTTPQLAAFVDDAVQISAGRFHTCAVRDAGEVTVETDNQAWCWGDGNNFKTGTGSTADTNTPQAVSGLGPAVEVATGNEHSCALRPDGRIACWGSDASGAVGDGNNGAGAKSSPRDVINVASFTSVESGTIGVCGDSWSGKVFCWGNGANIGYGVPLEIYHQPLSPVIDGTG